MSHLEQQIILIQTSYLVDGSGNEEAMRKMLDAIYHFAEVGGGFGCGGEGQTHVLCR